MKKSAFADLPLSKKLRRIQAVSVGLALVITLLVNILTEIWSEQRNARLDIETTGNIIGFNAGIALMFNDSKSATDILAALRNKPTVLAACLYRTDGELLSQYPSEQSDVCPPSAQILQSDLQLNNEIFSLKKKTLLSIEQQGDNVGHLLLIGDLLPMWETILKKFSLISLVMLAAFSITAIFGKRLARLISKPIMDLSTIAQQMSREKNYSLRARDEGHDEIGRLVKSFNSMMEQIQERDDQLEQHSAHLEHEVQIRTADLRNAVLEAEAASIAKSQFLANMSHEIRTPMNGVIGMVDVLFNTELSEEQKKMVQVIRESAYTQLGILNDILDFSKIEAGKMELSVGPFSIHDVIANLCDLLDKQAQQKTIDLRHSIDPTVPQAVEGDMLRLRQVLSNLITNAIKFSAGQFAPGKVSLEAHLSKDESSKIWVTFSVRDNGIGMSESTMSRLFQSFEQGDISTTRRYGGTGLGLVISRRLVELMGGTIEVDSQLDVGSTFTVHLPFKRTKAENLPQIKDSDWFYRHPELSGIGAAPSRDQALLHQRLILVAEDNETNQDVIKQQLAMLGYAADIAADGHEALAMWREEQYCLLLTDIHMPYMDGYQLTEAIRQEESQKKLSRLPIIALTAVALKGEDENCIKIGMDDYLSKPAPLTAMKAMLDKWLPEQKEPAVAQAQIEQPASQQAAQAPFSGETEPDYPVWDENALGRVVGNNPTMQQHLLEKFLSQANDKIHALCAAADSGDASTVGNLAHAFKSASRTIGAMQLGELCFALEKLGKAGDIQACLAMSAQLQGQLNLAEAAIKQKLSANE